MPRQVTRTTFTVDACQVACEVSGEGRPVLLIHGLGASTALWSELRGAFGPDYRVIAFDLRGAGKTRELEPAELSLETWSSDLRGLLDALGVARPVLVGHSLGAAVALKHALRFPDDVRALVLMGTEANLSHLGPRMRSAAESIERLGLARWIDEHWSQNTPFSAESLARAPGMLERYRAMLLGNDDRNYVRTCLAIASAEDMSQRLGEVTQPALVIVGREDDRTLPEHGRELAVGLRARLVEIPGVGHTLPLEAPREVAAAVREFLASLDGRETP